MPLQPRLHNSIYFYVFIEKIYKLPFLKHNMQKKVTLSVDSNIYKKFQEFCEKNAIMLSKKIEICMEDIMKNKKVKDEK